MPKGIEDHGHAVALSKPLKPLVRRPNGKGDPVQLAGCIIIVCDPGDANSLQIEMSDGSRWRPLKFADEGEAVARVAPTIDIEAIKREVINAAIAEMPQPSVKVISPPADVGGDGAKVLAQGLVEVSDHVATLAQQSAASEANLRQQLADLEARIRYIEHNALAKAKIA